MPTRVYILLSLLCLLLQTGKAQVYFNNRYDTFGSCDGTNGIDTMYNGYLSAEITCSSSSFNTFMLGLYNLDGTLRKNKVYLRPGMNLLPNSGKYLRANNHNFWVSGTRVYKPDTTVCFLWRFNSNLDSVSCFEYGFLNKINVISSFVASGKYIYMTGYTDSLTTNSDILLIKTDTAGNEIWKKKIGVSGLDEAAYSIIETNDSKLLICGHKGYHNSSSDGMYIAKVDTSGQVIWDKNYVSTYGAFNSAVLLGDNSVVAVGSDGLSWIGSNVYYKNIAVRLDANGTEIWKKHYDKLSQNTGFQSIIQNNDGNFVVAGQKMFSNNTLSGTVYEINQNGDSLFSREYRILPNSQNYFRDVIQAPDRGYCFSGFVSPLNGDGGTQDIWLLKVDSNFCESAGICTTGIDDREMGSGTVNIYPNPANNEVYFEFAEHPSKPLLVELSNAQGSIICTTTIQNTHEPYRLNLSDYAEGVYFYRVSAGADYLKTGKIVVIK